MSIIKFPHPLVLLMICILLAMFASYFIPAGQFDRVLNTETNRMVVVSGSYHQVAAKPVGLFQALVAVPKGMVDGASVIFFVFLVGGAFVVVDRTGALEYGVNWIVGRLSGKGILVIPFIILFFATGGALENMQEEIIALVPLLILLTKRLGFDNLTAAAISVGAAAIGSSFSPVNPFQVGIAQKLAQMPMLSGGLYRLIFLFIALFVYGFIVIRRAKKIRKIPEHHEISERKEMRLRHLMILLVVIGSFSAFIAGVMMLNWDFEQMAVVFFIMGMLSGIIGKLGINGTADAFVQGFRDMAFAGILIGFARAIFVVLDEGRIIDSIVYGMFLQLADLPLFLSATGMTFFQSIIHFPVPSVSGQAVLTMPILVPLSDLLGMSRQVIVMAYQYGAGMCEIITPTNGALMAILAAAGVPFKDWIRFALPVYLVIIVIGLIAIYLAIAIGI